MAEREAVDLVVRRASTKQISQVAIISEYTVQEYLFDVFEKVGERWVKRFYLESFFEDYSVAIANPTCETGRGVGLDRSTVEGSAALE